MKTSARLPGWKQDEFWQSGWHRLELPAVFSHILSIPFNCSDTALRVAEAMIGAKVIIFVFHHVCFVSRIWHQNTSPGSLAISPLRNRAEISHMSPRRILSQQPGQPGQPGSCEEACFSKVLASFQAWNQYSSHNLKNLADKPVHFFFVNWQLSCYLQNYWNFSLECEHQQLSGPVNYWDFREMGPTPHWPHYICSSLVDMKKMVSVKSSMLC